MRIIVCWGRFGGPPFSKTPIFGLPKRVGWGFGKCLVYQHPEPQPGTMMLAISWTRVPTSSKVWGGVKDAGCSDKPYALVHNKAVEFKSVCSVPVETNNTAQNSCSCLTAAKLIFSKPPDPISCTGG